ncbi:GntR family transcriptional regulator [Mycoplasmatota bacterium zrk1]
MTAQINKKPLYVDIYEKIYETILSGEMKPGDKLPGEVTLSKSFNVSRGTLRQALLILQENGIIYNKQGKGNFVSNATKRLASGLEKLVPIPYSFSNEELEENLINVLYEAPGKYLKDALQIDNSSIVMICHKEYSIRDNVCCYSLYVVPNTVLSDFSVEINDKDQISQFVDNELLKYSAKSTARIVFSEAGEFLKDILDVPLNTKVVMFEETIYDAQGNVMAVNRHSMLPEYFDFTVNRSKM